ncbi:MAG TPA: 1-acyl-sn-glycerol-3-phosphate acyltransferase, partial [Nannocystaceae bacterium]|nr:1-acyl-sn-glycerol-3-phosphate acyltransferase [Nannocystaceae bacterium]
GSLAEVAYDVPPDAWYVAENPARVMPYAVLLEVALQPCGWLASYIGSARTTDIDLVFRNLDGSGTVHREVPPHVGTLTTTTTLSSLSTAGGLIIVGFKVVVRAGDELVYTFDTVFGFFTKETMKSQVGLPTTPESRALLTAPSDVHIDLSDAPAPFFGGTLRLADPMLRMIDRITGLWPAGGKAGKGRVRAEKDVDPGEWFFKAHFFQDPVQPGSLGLEALLQALQALMIARGLGEGLTAPRFEPIAAGRAMTWKYRGQVVPENAVVVSDLDVTDSGVDERGPFVVADGSLWVDGKRIYEVRGLAMRVVPGDATPPRAFDRARIRAFWREVTGASGGWAGEDLLFALLDAFVGEVHLEDAEGLALRRGEPALYLANHQVAVETILAAIVLGGVTGTVPTLPAKAEHRHTWVGESLRRLTARPGLRDPDLLRFIDRADPTSVLRLRDDLLADFRAGRSALVHVEGTRARSCRERVTTMSSVFLDLAIAAGVDVVPVRFVGGLPIAPSAERLEIPIGHGKQDLWIGRPIPTTELAALPFA